LGPAMCYGSTARPPLPPNAGAGSGAAGRDVVLMAQDGNRFNAFTALADGRTSGGPGMVILPDVRGLHEFYRDLALRFAEASIHATAFDYFGRTAGIEPRTEDFDFMAHVRQTTPDMIALDAAEAIAHVRSPDGGAADAVFTVGFCFGGRNSFNQAARGHHLAGVIGFYGVPQQRETDDTNAPVLLAKSYRCPVLGLFGGEDRAISKTDVDAFRQALEAAGVKNEIVVYDGAPHSFFDRSFEQYRKESDDSWIRMLRFVEDNA
ncbi:MAG TPA: dienelactone hydrolase family protein, partial [Actinomycetota bacterium]|nr:dienelactone hydrolase family protein [Actinomycetota bacterium]